MLLYYALRFLFHFYPPIPKFQCPYLYLNLSLIYTTGILFNIVS